MTNKKNILIINGSANVNSSNDKLIQTLIHLSNEFFHFEIFNKLKALPHFDPELSTENPPKSIIEFRNKIEKADGIIICTPEYVFSIPSGLKNSIEWCVSTIVFSDKPTGLITASSVGIKAHEELKLIMKTLSAKFTEETTLLIQGLKSKLNSTGEITDKKTKEELQKFIFNFIELFKT